VAFTQNELSDILEFAHSRRNFDDARRVRLAHVHSEQALGVETPAKNVSGSKLNAKHCFIRRRHVRKLLHRFEIVIRRRVGDDIRVAERELR
jgi:hypothetical protein